jgi:hypothetical protein
MTIEEYVDGLKKIVPEHFIESTKDWSTSDKMYVFLHYIQLSTMDKISKELKIISRDHKDPFA